MRFGIEFSDGRKATTVRPHRPRHPQDTPEQPLLMMRGGGGGRRFEADFWVWPLPPPGPLAFVCDWREHGIELTRKEVDAQAILDSAAKVEQLWPDERPEPKGAWTIARG
jgi:hypothetical protein